jgi:hypothetical protein
MSLEEALNFIFAKAPHFTPDQALQILADFLGHAWDIRRLSDERGEIVKVLVAIVEG